jgi:hypothetical protein
MPCLGSGTVSAFSAWDRGLMAHHGPCGAGTSRPQSASFPLPASGVPAPSAAPVFENAQTLRAAGMAGQPGTRALLREDAGGRSVAAAVLAGVHV